MRDDYHARYEADNPVERLRRRVSELEEELAQTQQLMQNSLDSLPVHIAILDNQGTIVFVNTAWNKFALKQGALIRFGVGSNYLEICESTPGPEREEALQVAQGIRQVLAGRKGIFVLEYSCHTPTQEMWFEMKVTRCWTQKQLYGFVIHENITLRRATDSKFQDKASPFDASLLNTLNKA